MPKMSDTMVEGVIAKWHKKVGDTVKSGELMAEVETDKATMDYESFNTGTVLYLGAKEGEAIKINDVLAVVMSPDEQAELDRLIAQHPEVDPFAYQLSLPPVPASLRARLLQRAAQDSPQTSGHFGWWVAGVLLLGAVVCYFYSMGD